MLCGGCRRYLFLAERNVLFGRISLYLLGVDLIKMRNMTDRGRKGISWGISIVLAACLTVLCIWDALPVNRRAAAEVVLLGDSIVGNTLNGKGIHTYLEELLGATVLKGGFGGSYAADKEQDVYPASVRSPLNLVNISRAIVDGDFSVQKAQIAYGDRYYDIMRQTIEYFAETAEQLSRVDFHQVKYLVIEHGTNDYNRGVRLDNAEDRLDESTFGGALRSSVERLLAAYPNMQIILMTPTWCYVEGDGELLYCDETDFGGGYLEEYADLEMEIAEEYGLPVLDNYHESGINRDTAAQYLQDGLHLSNDGQRLIAERLAALIDELEGKSGS